MSTHFSLLSVLIMLSIIFFSCSQSKYIENSRVDYDWNYELEAENTGTAGSYLVKVWSYTDQSNMPIHLVTRNAVHGVLFKGFPDKERISGQKAIIRNQETRAKHQEYFQNFFKEGGPYQQYVTLTNAGKILPGDRIRLGTDENSTYKIGMVVQVNVADLRRHLEEDGIIRPLGDIFN